MRNGCVRKAAPTVLLLATLLSLGAPRLRPQVVSDVPATPDPAAEQIIQRLIERNRERARLLAGYRVARQYHLKNELYEKEVVLDVEVIFSAPTELAFDVRHRQGSGFLARQVFGRMMEGEQESLQPEIKRRSALTPHNYAFRLEGREALNGRPAYRLAIHPQRKDTFLFEGRVWVDAEDFAVVRATGRPAKRPSFWTRKIDFVRIFRKVGPFWLPARTESVTEVLLFGTSWVTIQNEDYRVQLRTGVAQEP